MRRGEGWTVAGGPNYTGKPRPAVILQADEFIQFESVTLCPLTSSISESPLYRPLLEPDQGNGLRSSSRAMADKISTLPRGKLGMYVGKLAENDVERLNQAALVFLGLAGSARSEQPTPVGEEL